MLFIEEPTQWIGTFDKPLSPLFSVWEGSLRLYRRLFNRVFVANVPWCCLWLPG